jgi:hypothetical protein
MDVWEYLNKLLLWSGSVSIVAGLGALLSFGSIFLRRRDRHYREKRKAFLAQQGRVESVLTHEHLK